MLALQRRPTSGVNICQGLKFVLLAPDQPHTYIRHLERCVKFNFGRIMRERTNI